MKDIVNKIRCHSNIVGYGAGQYYDYIKNQIPQDIHLDFLCDAMWQQIGEGTEIEEAQFFLTNGSIEVGRDCLFSHRVTLRNHDTHHIFDKETRKRINYPGNIKIGDHVWIGHGATLLGSASVGDHSIVGTMAVTSSSFPKEVVIAGNPARIIREHVCWSKDNTNYYNRDSLEECLAKEAIRYF